MLNKNFGLSCFKDINEKTVKYASEKKLNYIEIHLDKNNIQLNSFTSERIEYLNKLSENYNISYSLHNPFYINASDIISTFRKIDTKYILNSIVLAKDINALHITAHIGNFYWFPVEKWMRKKALNRFISSMEKVIHLCDKYNISFAFENVVPIPKGSDYFLLGDNLEDFNYLFSNLDSKYFNFCLDTGHANIGVGVIPYIKAFAEKLVSVHYHDNLGTDDNHLPVGKGSINWKSVINELEKVSYKGPLISECRNIKPHEAANLLNQYF